MRGLWGQARASVGGARAWRAAASETPATRAAASEGPAMRTAANKAPATLCTPPFPSPAVPVQVLGAPLWRGLAVGGGGVGG